MVALCLQRKDCEGFQECGEYLTGIPDNDRDDGGVIGV